MIHRSIRLPAELQRRVDVKAAAQGTSLNAVVVAGLRAYLGA
jgi:predicted HicB family RNase H-like nuclease